MNTSTQTQVVEERPPCFGKLWNPNETECNGGADPKYTHPRNGGHVREKCDFFNSCGATVQAALISPQSLVRPPLVTPAPATTSDGFRRYMQQRQIESQQAEEMRRQVALQQQQRVMPVAPYPTTPYPYYPQAAPQPVQHPAYGYPAPSYQLNYMMPGYLTVPEMRVPGQSLFGLLGREALRSMGKSLGHTISNFFDVHPFRLPPAPGGDETK